MAKFAPVFNSLLVIALVLGASVTAVARSAPAETGVEAVPPDPPVGAANPDGSGRAGVDQAALEAARAAWMPSAESTTSLGADAWADCTVLLVDDDWDQYSGEPYNGTGTYYYTSTLEALGVPYDRWNSWAQGDPALADMAGYDVVLWFTGYAWQDTIMGTDEIQLAAYLDGGGNLIVSGADYIYDQGITAFGATYLGLGSAVQDTEETDVLGNVGDPIGDGLGPYTLTVPSSWPTSGSLFTDQVEPRAGAGAPFRYQASATNNSADVDGGVFRTVFLAWPLEAIADVDDRAEVLGAALRWMCMPSVLLVDDDWDQYSGEPFNGTGTYYYTSTLEALGVPYHRWDAWTQGDPALADMEGYDVVLWFTGYAWDDTITQTNEIHLAAYLDGGGNLIVSAEDYLFDRGITPFGRDYLGLSSAVNDTEETDVVGNAGDPIGGGLGPYTLTVPSSWPTTGASLFTDRVEPRAGAGAPFRYQASAKNNSTDLDGRAFKTVFLAWPLEAIAHPKQRAQILGTILNWMSLPGPEFESFLPVVFRG